MTQFVEIFVGVICGFVVIGLFIFLLHRVYLLCSDIQDDWEANISLTDDGKRKLIVESFQEVISMAIDVIDLSFDIASLLEITYGSDKLSATMPTWYIAQENKFSNFSSHTKKSGISIKKKKKWINLKTYMYSIVF